MRKNMQDLMTEIAHYLEIMLSIILGIAVIFLTFSLLKDLTGVVTSSKNMDSLFENFLGRLMALAIGVELIKMFSKPSPNTVIEVLLFAVSRQLIVDHPTILNFLIGIVAVAILFAIRKYLSTESTPTRRKD